MFLLASATTVLYLQGLSQNDHSLSVRSLNFAAHLEARLSDENHASPPSGPSTLSPGRTAPANDITVPVARVIDGDTIIAQYEGKLERIRLIGVNAPESVDPHKPVQCFGPESAAYLKTLLSGAAVTISLDPTQRVYDKYGRLLAYIFRSDGLFVNEDLVRRGFAYEYTYATVYAYQARFKEDEQEAKANGLGLWATNTCNGKFSNT